MRLYLNNCLNCSNKIYLNLKASSRGELRQKLRSEYFYATCQTCSSRQIYNVTEVEAEAEGNSSLGSGLVGGLIGLIGGPLGLIIGGGIGLGIGSSIDGEERKKVDFFNQSR